MFGDPSKSILEKVFRPLGGEKTFEAASGNLASDLLSSSGPAKEAAAAFVAKYGKGTGRSCGSERAERLGRKSCTFRSCPT